MLGIKDKPKILVVDSFVKDLTVSTNRFPEVGETVLGCGFQTASGGKGANQAIQAARLGAHVTMVGKVGDDIYGKEMINSCVESGIDCSRVKVHGSCGQLLPGDVVICVIQRLSLLLQTYRNLDPAQYIKWHPGGTLGKLRDNEK